MGEGMIGKAAASPSPRETHGCPGKSTLNRFVAGACPVKRGILVYFLVVETQKTRRGMQFIPSIFGQALETINRRVFQTIVDRHNGDAYDKSFDSWDHLVTLVFAQLSACDSLRGLVNLWNAGSQHHYHLGCGPLKRSTVSDANQRRPVAVFADLLKHLAGLLDRTARKQNVEMIRLIDSTPIPLGGLCDWALSNGRIRGMKAHVLYDPIANVVNLLDITNANVNDAPIARAAPIAAGATYVFDKGYCHYAWWSQIAADGALFVTRPKTNMQLKTKVKRALAEAQGDGFLVLEDREVRLTSRGDSKLAMPLRRIKLKRQENGDKITLITNDMTRSAIEIGALYKMRWRIELLFRWLKQHLKIGKFLGNSPNAIRLQILAAMIAHALLLILQKTCRKDLQLHRLLEYVRQHIFDRRRLVAIEKPPPINKSRRIDRTSPNQIAFQYA
jgi:putative transposase